MFVTFNIRNYRRLGDNDYISSKAKSPDLLVTVVDENKLRDDKIGDLKVTLRDLLKRGNSLSTRKLKVKDHKIGDKASNGTISFSLHFRPIP